MLKILLVLVMILGLLSFGGNSSADEFYKWVDAKGTTNFSDNPTSGFFDSQYKEKILIKDGSVHALKDMSFGERQIPKDQLLNYFKSGGGGQRTPSRREDVSTSDRSTGRRAISSGFSPFRLSEGGGGGSHISGTGEENPLRKIYPRKIYPRKVYGR